MRYVLDPLLNASNERELQHSLWDGCRGPEELVASWVSCADDPERFLDFTSKSSFPPGLVEQDHCRLFR